MPHTIDRPGADEWVPAPPSGRDAAPVRSLAQAAEHCRGCELWADATQVVFSSGSPRASVMLVGEQPGDQEDLAGEPFVGPAGRVLREALDTAGLPVDDVYLTNAVKHFRHRPAPAGKRRIHEKPDTAHIVACHPWLEAELAAVGPAVIVCLGATAGRSVLGRPVKIGAERGRVLEERPPAVPADSRILITTHPSALLRLRGKPEWEEAFDAFVADLEVARDEAGLPRREESPVADASN
jgi:DNA polymerase